MKKNDTMQNKAKTAIKDKVKMTRQMIKKKIKKK